MYLIYTKPDCPYCEKAKQFLSDINEPYETVALETQDERNAFLDRRSIVPPNRTWPRIYFRESDTMEREIGGYKQLLEMHMKA